MSRARLLFVSARRHRWRRSPACPTANAGRQRLADYERYAEAPIDHFTFFRMDDWEVLGREQVLRTTQRDAYLVKVDPSARIWEWANAIGVTSSVNTVHHRGMDSVVVRGLAPHPGDPSAALPRLAARPARARQQGKTQVPLSRRHSLAARATTAAASVGCLHAPPG